MIAFLRHVLFTDFWLKLFSLSLAILTWLAVYWIQGEVAPGHPLTLRTSERTFAMLPVMVMSSAADVRNLRVNPKEVEVTVQGDEKVLSRLQGRDIHVLVDLTGIEAAHDLRKRIEVSTPAGVTHVRVYPQEVQVVFPPKS